MARQGLTYKPNKKKKAKKQGFRARMASKNGRRVISRRRTKKRQTLVKK